MKTVRELRACACESSESFWDAVNLDDDMPLDELRERWTPLAAVWLARADGRGPRVGAVAWVDDVPETRVLVGADLHGLDLRYVGIMCSASLDYARLVGADLSDVRARNTSMIKTETDGVDMSSVHW